jgi:Mn-dependent DtxR family transcriptional regulator
MATFTHRQGQFLAFIHLYRRLHRRGPAELDLVKFFRVTPPSVHGMVVNLEDLGLICCVRCGRGRPTCVWGS